MNKTPEQVALEKWSSYFTQDGNITDITTAIKGVVFAVIEHLTPQIESKARAAAIEDFLDAIRHPDGKDFEELRDLAPAPAGHVCVSINPSPVLIDSMCVRYRHDFGFLDDRLKDSMRITMRQLHEEVVGKGYYRGPL
jgi:hypothetical protein